MYPMDGYNIRTPAAEACEKACRKIRRRWFRKAWKDVMERAKGEILTDAQQGPDPSPSERTGNRPTSPL